MTEQGVSLDALREKVRLLWAQACSWEGVHPKTNFVVFSPENPYSQTYNTAYQEWMAVYRPTVEE